MNKQALATFTNRAHVRVLHRFGSTRFIQTTDDVRPSGFHDGGRAIPALTQGPVGNGERAALRHRFAPYRLLSFNSIVTLRGHDEADS